jgi:hypothetical protein
MSLSNFEATVLSYIANDYEAIHTIIEDLSMGLHRPVSIEELAVALINLVRTGMAESLVPTSSQYQRVDVNSLPVKDLWFLATKSGLDKLKELFP